MSWTAALRTTPLTEEQMEGRVCFCSETGNPDEFGDGSSLPCMSMEPDNMLRCKTCIYCVLRSEVIK